MVLLRAVEEHIVDGSSRSYRVTGVRADRSRHVLALKLSLEDATYLSRVLMKANIFKSVLIQSDESSPDAEEPSDEHRPSADTAQCA
jgi:hypothetical protein